MPLNITGQMYKTMFTKYQLHKNTFSNKIQQFIRFLQFFKDSIYLNNSQNVLVNNCCFHNITPIFVYRCKTPELKKDKNHRGYTAYLWSVIVCSWNDVEIANIFHLPPFFRHLCHDVWWSENWFEIKPYSLHF